MGPTHSSVPSIPPAQGKSDTQVPTLLSSHGSLERLPGEKRNKMKNISATKSSYQQNPGSTFQVFSPRRSLALSLAYVSCDTVLWSQLSARALQTGLGPLRAGERAPHPHAGPAEAADAARSVLAAIVKSPRFQVSIYGAPTLCPAPTRNRHTKETQSVWREGR